MQEQGTEKDAGEGNPRILLVEALVDKPELEGLCAGVYTHTLNTQVVFWVSADSSLHFPVFVDAVKLVTCHTAWLLQLVGILNPPFPFPVHLLAHLLLVRSLSERCGSLDITPHLCDVDRGLPVLVFALKRSPTTKQLPAHTVGLQLFEYNVEVRVRGRC